MITGIHHIALVVRDLDGAERYYRAVAGMQRLPAEAARAIAPGLPGAAAVGETPHTRLLVGRNAYLELLAWGLPSDLSAPANPINRPGLRHFCVQNVDCSILEQAVLANGGSLIAPPLDLGTGNQYAYARDAEGNILEIEGLPYAPVGEPTWLGHVAMVTRDMDRAIAFYAPLLGSPLHNRRAFEPRPQFDRMGGLVDARLEGAWLQTNTVSLELWQFHAPIYTGEPAPRQFLDPGYSHLCLETDNINTDAARLVELGGALLSGVAENGDARSVFASDPEGNVIELLQLRDPTGPLSIAALTEPAICARIEAGR